MSVNKVVIGDTIVIDLSQDTVVPEAVLIGIRFHMPDGTIKEGTLDLSQYLTETGEQTVKNKTISAADNSLPGVALEANSVVLSGETEDNEAFSFDFIIKAKGGS